MFPLVYVKTDMPASNEPYVEWDVRPIFDLPLDRKTNILQRIDNKHSVVIKRGVGPTCTYITMRSMGHAHLWMQRIPDDERHLYYTNLTRCKYVTPQGIAVKSLVGAAFICQVAWFSPNDQPDPLAPDRLKALRTVMQKAVQQMRNKIKGSLKLKVRLSERGDLTPWGVEEFGTLAKGHHHFKNSFTVSMPNVIFANTGPTCMGNFVSKLLIPLAMDKYPELLGTSTTDWGTNCIVDHTIYHGACELLMPGCCHHGEPGRPRASLKQWHALKPNYHAAALNVEQREYEIITSRMVGTMTREMQKSKPWRYNVTTAVPNGGVATGNTHKKHKASHMVVEFDDMFDDDLATMSLSADSLLTPQATVDLTGTHPSEPPATTACIAQEEEDSTLKELVVVDEEEEKEKEGQDTPNFEGRVEPEDEELVTCDLNANTISTSSSTCIPPVTTVGAVVQTYQDATTDVVPQTEVAQIEVDAKSIAPPPRQVALVEKKMKSQIVAHDKVGVEKTGRGGPEPTPDAPCMPDPKTLCVPLPEPHPVSDSEPEPTPEPEQEPEPQLVYPPMPKPEHALEPDPEPRPVSEYLAGNRMSDAASTIETVVQTYQDATTDGVPQVEVETKSNVPPPCQMVVVEKKEKITQTLHLGTDELPQVDDWPSSTQTGSSQRVRDYHHIASSMPPDLVTKEGYRLTHSLSHAAFEGVHRRLQQLKVVQALARLDAKDLFKDVESYAHAGNPADDQQTQGVIDATRCAVATICSLIAVIGDQVDTSALTSGFDLQINMNVTNKVAEEVTSTSTPANIATTSDHDVAYSWIKRNWKMILGLPSRSCPLDPTAPGDNDVDKLTNVLQSILREQTGLNWHKQKNADRFDSNHMSIWKTVGINLVDYIAWYRSPHAAQFGIIQKSVQCCQKCDGVGGDILCLRQESEWRCVSKGTEASWSHRQPYEPLDVNGAWILDDEDEKRDDGTLVDRLMGHLGFAHGAMVDTAGISLEQMTLAWSVAVLTPKDKVAVLVSHQIDLSDVLQDRSKLKILRKYVKSILKDVGLQLKVRRPRTPVSKMRPSTTYIATL
jgi:hypothetical protein